MRRSAVPGLSDDFSVLTWRVPNAESLPQIPQAGTVVLMVEDYDVTSYPNDIRREIGPCLLLPNVFLITTHRSGPSPSFDEYSPARPCALTLSALQRTDARSALAGPAAVAGIIWERGLIERVLDDLTIGTSSSSDAEPPVIDPSLLALVAAELAGAAGSHPTHAKYEEGGGVAGSIWRMAEPALQGLERRARRLMVLLAAGAELFTIEDARAFVGGSEADKILERLVEARLIRIGDFVELRHPLLAASPTLLRWLRKERDTVAAVETVKAARHLAEATGGAVLPGTSTLLWISAKIGGDSASKPLLEAAMRRSFRNQVIWIVACALAVVLGFGVREQMYRREKRRELIAEANDFAKRSQDVLKTDPVRALVLAIEAGKRQETVPSRQALINAIRASRLRAVLKHEGWVSSAEFSADGRTLVTAEIRPVAHIWNVATAQELAVTPYIGLGHIEISPAGNTVIYRDPLGGGLRGKLAWLDMSSPTPWRLFAQLPNVVFKAISPDGHQVLTVDGDEVALWSLLEGTKHVIAMVHGARRAWFSPRGDSIVMSLGNGSVRVFLLNGPPGNTKLSLLHPGGLASLAFSSDGKRIFTTGVKDHSARQWKLDPDGTPQPLPWVLYSTSQLTVGSGGFDSQERHVALVDSTRDSVHVWPVAKPDRGFLIPFPSSLRNLAFDRSSPTLAVGGAGGTVVIYRLASSGDSIRTAFRLIGHTGDVNAIVFSADGRRIVTTSNDRTARIWSMEEPQVPQDFKDLLALAQGSLPVTLTRDEMRQLQQ